MKRILAIIAVWALLCRAASAQGLLPFVEGQFFANSGAPLALGKICTTTSGGSTNLATYPTYADAVALTNANANPVVLDAFGRANIWLPGGTAYRIRIIAAGTGGTACNGDTAVGTTIKTVDGVTTGVSVINALTINGVQMCDQYPGATAGAKIQACIAALPTAGGIANATGIMGAQTTSSDPFGGTTKPLTLLLGCATFTNSATWIVPANGHILGLGKCSKITSASSSLPAAEAIRLNGDYASISNVWLSGSGQGDGSVVNGRRGIWLGLGSGYTDLIADAVYYARIENVIIDQFIGNGISGNFFYSHIVNNVVINNTDANLFCQPSCQRNLFQGNTANGSRYSGFDINGSDNRFIGNTANSNGGGNLDLFSQAGFLVVNIPASATQPNGNRNILEGNTADANVAQGFFIYNSAPTSAAAQLAITGTVLANNTATSHLTQTSQKAGTALTAWGGGIVVMGAYDTVVNGNVSANNNFNYIIVGDNDASNSTSPGTIVSNNKSYRAVKNSALTTASKPSGIGFFFPTSALVDGTGGYPAQDVILTGNSDRQSQSDSFQWFKDAATAAVSHTGWTISGNHSDGAGTNGSGSVYGFNVQNPGTFFANTFRDNTAINARTSMATGFNSVGLTANSTTPSVINGMFFLTANNAATTVTNFTSGIMGQAITVAVGDNNTTFDFTGSNLKGNAGVDMIAFTGDQLTCGFDGTNWLCDTMTQAVSGGYANGAGASTTQAAGAKTNAVTLNGLLAAITTDNATLNAGVIVAFTWTNSYITANSMVVCVHNSAGTVGSYTIQATPGVGSAVISIRNNTAGNLGEALVLKCRVFPVQ